MGLSALIHVVAATTILSAAALNTGLRRSLFISTVSNASSSLWNVSCHLPPIASVLHRCDEWGILQRIT